jgi:hypothetical protein
MPRFDVQKLMTGVDVKFQVEVEVEVEISTTKMRSSLWFQSRKTRIAGC